jgi:hypothetical protein
MKTSEVGLGHQGHRKSCPSRTSPMTVVIDKKTEFISTLCPSEMFLNIALMFSLIIIPVNALVLASTALLISSEQSLHHLLVHNIFICFLPCQPPTYQFCVSLWLGDTFHHSCNIYLSLHNHCASHSQHFPFLA